MKLKTLINSNKLQFDKQFKKLLKVKLNKSILSKAIYYGSNNGGKRIRPFLVNQSSKIAKINNYNAFILSASIECIHSYSLIHDDLPCMDNDDYRRGKLSTHKKFDEATAILAGDALHDLAFELMSSEFKKIDPKSNINLINYLSLCLGHSGLALGQALDLEFENKKISKNKILNMYLNKTGKLFEFCFAAPFILANLKIDKVNFAKEYGQLFGLIFQIADDIIDETGTFENIGKTPGKDSKQGKSTLSNVMGKEEALELCNKKIVDFENKYKSYLNNKKNLINILKFGLNRLS
ncbi:polyprenyl synthetase family protein [Pelagibacteraceae bacterium]|nr:polyprenyl synthetase family protein [Pelagibacteraceae bacterium]